MSTLQSILHTMEEGKGSMVLRLIPLVIALFVIFLIYNFAVYRGLDDPQSMDNAQLARQIVRGQGFTTLFIRPNALGQFNALATAAAAKAGNGNPPELFPIDRYPSGTPRVLPDTYNAPGYPYLLAAWFRVIRPDFNQDPNAIAGAHMYAGDRSIPWFNQIFLLLSAGLVFLLGLRVFDQRVAWLSLGGLLTSDLVWQYSITALSTTFLMFLLTAALLLAVQIFSVAEVREKDRDAVFWPAWLWALLLGLLLGIACLTRLHLLVFLIPVGVFLYFVPRANFLFILLVVGIVLVMVAPWFWHMYNVSGDPLGSNARLLQLSSDDFPGNQVFCTLDTPKDTQFLKDLGKKESAGFLWHFNHGWELLGSSPLALLFVASLLHHFRRKRAQALRWLIVGAAFCLVAANNLGLDSFEAVSPWNILVVLLPGILVVGSAFFFILLDRLNLEHALLNTVVTIALVAVTAFPLVLTLLKVGGYGGFNYPPYSPVYIRYLSHFTHPEGWITTDMPWATAWYGDRASLWLPDTIADFNRIHDDINASDILLLTPVSLARPADDLISGEEKDWFPFISGNIAPADFPLNSRVPPIKNGPDYIIWARHH